MIVGKGVVVEAGASVGERVGKGVGLVAGAEVAVGSDPAHAAASRATETGDASHRTALHIGQS